MAGKIRFLMAANREWLQERKKIGADSVIVSLAGMGAVHDGWNGRRGDFDYLMSALRIAGELGLGLGERLFLAQSTLPDLERLIDCLDSIPGRVVERIVVPFLYRGQAERMEEERITEKTRDSLPESIKQLASWGLGNWRDWRSEREWIEVIRSQQEQPREVRLPFQINKSTIERMESMPPEVLVAEQEARTRAAYAAIPSSSELCERNADATNCRIYTNQDDIERKWLEHHLQKSSITFERALTHLDVGS
jgi:hypothetical protein